LVSPESGTMYRKFFDALKLKVLGLTATPIRMKRYNFPLPHAKICMLDRMRPKFFSEYIHITQIYEMKENKYFADIDYFSFDFDESKLHINTTGGDYTETSISLSLMANSTLQKIANLYFDIKRKDRIKHILIFVESIKSAFELQKLIGLHNCSVVTGKTNKKERAETLKLFKDGMLNAVINVGVLTTGFDFTALDCIIGARPTMSLGLYYQIIGRGVRPHLNKEKCYVFDFVGNFKRFGKVENLSIEKRDGLWCIHNGERILTNLDISGKDLDVFDRLDKTTDSTQLMPFGKYKGQELNIIPNSYWTWFMKEIQKNKYNKFIFDYIENNVLITK
jgi:DNA repair protein RadD